MSIKTVRDIFEHCSESKDWSFQLLTIKTSKDADTFYVAKEIGFDKKEKGLEFLKNLSFIYSDSQKGKLNKKMEVLDYDGTAREDIIYKILTDDEVVAQEYKNLNGAIADPDYETDALEFKYTAYDVIGKISINGEEHRVKFFFMHNPVTTLRNKYFFSEGNKLVEISNKVISLKTAVDVVIIDDAIYLLTLDGEKLFNMERSYTNICHKKIEYIKEKNMISNFEQFYVIASSGHNPRKFLSFSDESLEALKSKKKREEIAKEFNIPLNQGKFNTETKENVDRLIKVLCKKAMTDPVLELPMEVGSTKKWK